MCHNKNFNFFSIATYEKFYNFCRIGNIRGLLRRPTKELKIIDLCSHILACELRYDQGLITSLKYDDSCSLSIVKLTKLSRS